MPSSAKSAKDLSRLKVAIVHDWLVGGGAERVVLELHRMFPDAPIYTSYCTAEWRKKLDNKVITGYLQRWPFSKLRKFLAVPRIWWFRQLDFSGYDLVISSSGNGEAFSVKTSKNTIHVNYCHTPTHYYWRFYDQYMQNPGFGIFNPLARLGLTLLVRPLRRWDFRAAQRADYIIANSTHIQADIKKFYNRDSTVIFPPVDVKRFLHNRINERRGFVTMGRLVPAKKVDVIIQACNHLRLPLKVIGDGPDYPRLKRLAGPTVSFYNKTEGNRISDADMPKQLAGSKAFLFASFDDFGIAPVEALSAGTPVIAYRTGGALDYVIPGKTGEFFDHQTPESLIKALEQFNAGQYDPKTIQAHAQQFSPQSFHENLTKFLQTV